MFVQGPQLTKVTEAVAGFGDMVSTRTLQWRLRLGRDVRDDFSVFVYKSSSCNC